MVKKNSRDNKNNLNNLFPDISAKHRLLIAELQRLYSGREYNIYNVYFAMITI